MHISIQPTIWRDPSSGLWRSTSLSCPVFCLMDVTSSVSYNSHLFCPQLNWALFGVPISLLCAVSWKLPPGSNTGEGLPHLFLFCQGSPPFVAYLLSNVWKNSCFIYFVWFFFIVVYGRREVLIPVSPPAQQQKFTMLFHNYHGYYWKFMHLYDLWDHFLLLQNPSPHEIKVKHGLNILGFGKLTLFYFASFTKHIFAIFFCLALSPLITFYKSSPM